MQNTSLPVQNNFVIFASFREENIFRQSHNAFMYDVAYLPTGNGTTDERLHGAILPQVTLHGLN